MEDKFLDHGDKEVDLDEALIPALGKMWMQKVLIDHVTS
jgi:hypothetical protein